MNKTTFSAHSELDERMFFLIKDKIDAIVDFLILWYNILVVTEIGKNITPIEAAINAYLPNLITSGDFWNILIIGSFKTRPIIANAPTAIRPNLSVNVILFLTRLYSFAW